MSRLILVTGGSSGIGKSIAKALHLQGDRVILQARNLEKLEEASREIDSAGFRVSIYSTDLSDPASVEKTADQIVAEQGVPDILINSAGSGEWLSLNEADIYHYRDTINSPYLATALSCKAFYDQMKSRGCGHFIIINSAAAYYSYPGATGYIPARWAMMGFAKSMQADLYPTKFKVSLVTFGKVDSPYFSNNKRSENRIPKISDWLLPTLTLEQTTEVILKVIKSQKKIVNKPNMLSLLVFLNRLFPRSFSWLLRITGFKEEKRF
jgi:short-subunit dehydrogenase